VTGHASGDAELAVAAAGPVILSPSGLFVPAPTEEAPAGDRTWRMYAELSPEERAVRDQEHAAQLEAGGDCSCIWGQPNDEDEEAL
jgi:hypothetical protein